MPLVTKIKANKSSPKDGRANRPSSGSRIRPAQGCLVSWLLMDAARGCSSTARLRSLGNAMGMAHGPRTVLAHGRPPSPPAQQHHAKRGGGTWHLPSTAARSWAVPPWATWLGWDRSPAVPQCPHLRDGLALCAVSGLPFPASTTGLGNAGSGSWGQSRLVPGSQTSCPGRCLHSQQAWRPPG